MFGEYIKALRLAKKISLREFCLRNELDPGNHSRLERGRISAPERQDVLERLALALGLHPGTSDWTEFLDKAAIDRGKIPPELLEDQALLDKLPVLFRTLRGEPVNPEMLDALVEKVRKGL